MIKPNWKRILTITSGLLFSHSVFAAAQTDDLTSFLAQGQLLLDARMRYENVDQSGFSHDADAGTVRERLGYESAALDGFKALAELQATQHLTSSFNDSVNGRTAYPQVPDPESFELNRLQLAYGTEGVSATVGRQLVNLDDQRFVGASAFRQNEQTFDAARLDYAGVSGLALTYIYIDRVNRVFGDRSPAGHFNGDIHLFNAGYDVSDVGRLTAYAYLLDIDRNPALSTATYGLRLNGTKALDGELKLHYDAGYARQTGYAANPRSFAIDYWRAEGGLDYEAWSTTLGSEVLGGDGVTGFSTPLATLHPFQGYADVFLTTPARGIADRYGRLGYQTDIDLLDAPRHLSFAAWYHDFGSAHGQGSEGHETDLEAAARISQHWRLDVAYAAYDGTAGFASRHKTWIFVTTTY